MEFVKINKRPLTLRGVQRGIDYDYKFKFQGNLYYLSNFTRTHTMWTGDAFPDYISGVDTTNYYTPIYIEIVDGGEKVNVYCRENQQKYFRKER